ncbi:cysteine peptidase family C39 domain-containing protein [Pedobacter sp. L105]|uniref:cysteine peptidase family C39 domain-containing protein n=1 Tax=Pedobacter sp. L105 TaxID=1641871 RepID=UPI00131AE90D|nr:cysteine peptidase family C39 domain-containing protein [Pedobacter sp. L105]
MIKSFPYYPQRLETDCGPACLKMIACFYGKEFEDQQLLNNPRIKLNGASLLDICDAAESIGLMSRAFQTKVEFLDHIELPAILYWNRSHFVVLFEIKQRIYHIADPKKGIIKLSKRKLRRSWECISDNKYFEGVVLMFSVTTSFKVNSR